MKCSEYNKYFNDESKVIEDIQECAETHIRKIMTEQTISIGKPSVVKFDENKLFVYSEKRSLQVEINSYKLGTSLQIEVFVNDGLHRISISPLYFKKENIKNYLRECELDIKNQFSKIRRTNK